MKELNLNNQQPKVTKGFCVISMIYCSILLISNIIATKIIMPFGITLPCAVIVFPIVYIVSDLITEVYGIKLSILVITINTFINILMSIIFMIAIYIPSAPFYRYGNDFANILGSTPRLVCASLLAYYLGDFFNSISLSFFKFKYNNRGYFFRSIVSSLIGQVFDTCIFILAAFIFTMPFKDLIYMMIFQYIVKIVYEVICFPITKIVVNMWKKIENIDTIDMWNI